MKQQEDELLNRAVDGRRETQAGTEDRVSAAEVGGEWGGLLESWEIQKGFLEQVGSGLGLQGE